MEPRLWTPEEVREFADPRDHLAIPSSPSVFPLEHFLGLQPDRPPREDAKYGRSAYDPLEEDEVEDHPLREWLVGEIDHKRMWFTDLCNGRQFAVSIELPGEHYAVFLYTLHHGDDSCYLNIDFCGVFSA